LAGYRRKDFATLIRATKIVQGQRRYGLIIVGEGSRRPELNVSATSSSSTTRWICWLVDNPFALMSRAALVVSILDL